MKTKMIQIISLSILSLFPISGSGAELGTRQRTITPVAVTNAPVPPIFPSAVSNYAVYGYSAWKWGLGEDEGQQLTNMPAGYPGATNAARLFAFLSISDAHITDKESPCQAIYFSYQESGTNSVSACYSPVMLYTTQVLDAAIRTANAVNRLLPFDFAISLGDDANGPQYNELRWYIDVMDGKHIIPSSGAHVGATNIDYQEPFQAAGLDPAIPWYAVLGNHDHLWMGGLPITSSASEQDFTNVNVLRLGDIYMGTIDGSTPYGDVIDVGSVTNFIVDGVTNFPTVVADTNRYFLTVSNWMGEFFNTTSKPVGHGFSAANIISNFACYSFEPLTNMPVKVMVLDDTMTDQDYDPKGQAGLDANQLAWLVHELGKGQARNQLMIIAAHEPIEDIALPGSTNSVISNSNMLALLHSYPNLILWMCGHTHQNNIIPQPSPYPDRPEYGFWEVETASLRDFPQEFRAWEILRNTDNSISIRVTDIDPEETNNSPAAVSRGYAVGAARIFCAPCTNLTDTASYAYNAELLKLLTPPMQTKIANYGGPLGHNVAIDYNGNGVTINFLGDLQSADTLLGPWSYVTSISPYAVSAANTAKFYRGVE
jgi:metallophosphoesterase (TIGR03768 family)